MLARLLLSVLLCFSAAVYADIAPESASDIAAVKTLTAKNSIAVTANPYASQAAMLILEQGGNAIDAAIAAQMVLGLVEPQSSGIGGGAFLLFWQEKNQQLVHYDGRETAPKALSSQHFMLEQKPMAFFDALVGGHAVGTPGVLAMLELAHQQQGKLAWHKLFQTAIELADKGFMVSPRLHQLLLDVEKQPHTQKQQAFMAYFYPKGEAVKAGTILRNPAYASTLKTIAKQGAKAFYQGDIAEHISQAVQYNAVRSGKLSREDLAAYQATSHSAICHQVTVYQLCGSPPPSSGPLAVMQVFDVMARILTTKTDPLSGEFYRWYSEALAFAMQDRERYVADPDFVEVPVSKMLATNYLQKAADAIAKGDKNYQAPMLLKQRKTGIETEQPSTTHLSIRDRYGNIVSMTSSIEMAFGSRILVDGFLLNNQLTDFSFTDVDSEGQQVANRVEANKRPRSSMAPMIVFDQNKQPLLVIGSPGGARIISYVAKVLTQNLLLGLPLHKAVASPHITRFGEQLSLESSAPLSLQADLERQGYQLKLDAQTSGLHMIDLRHDKITGIADGRREGVAVGE